MTIMKGTLDRLRQFDTPTICNVIELFNVRPRDCGFMNASIKANFPEMPPMVGFAATATFRASGAPMKDQKISSVVEQVKYFEELSGPPVVVFQDVDNPPVAATFGEIMCTTYQKFGSTGLITSGAGRDLDQVRAIGYPVFTSCTICAHGFVHIPEVQIPVHVGGLVIYPDDLIHGDCNGVTTIPKEIAADVADIAADYVAAERCTLDVLQSENLDLKTYEKAFSNMMAEIGKLKKRVAAK